MNAEPGQVSLAEVNPAQVSLVTYVFNDGELADGLLEHAARWTIPPAEIIIVDDGSEVPYTPKQISGLPAVRLHRLEPNQGVSVSKSTGMNLATGEFILSMDCDMRLAPDWLEKSISEARRQEVGLIGVSVLCDGGNDLVSEYMRLFGHQMLPDGRADFLSGNVWLMRRSVWEEAGGFGDYKARTHEDHQYCKRVKAAGYCLMSSADRPGSQIRSLSRHDMVRRFASWFRENMVRHVRANPLPEVLRASIYTAFATRFDRVELIFKEKLNPAFFYFELLAFAYYAWAIFEEAGGQKEPAHWQGWLGLEQRAWRNALESLLAPYPLLLDVLKRDIEILGCKFSELGEADEETSAYWNEFFGVLKPLAASGGLFEELDKNLIKIIVQEDELSGRNFSFYSSL